MGYSRAVRVGAYVFVAGTTAPGVDAYSQAVAIFTKIEGVLREAGASLRHVVRTRMFVTNMDHSGAVGRAHAEFFRDILPAATMVEINRLISPELLVEIEVDAIVEDE